MQNQTPKNPIDRLIASGLDPAFIRQTEKTFLLWRETLNKIEIKDQTDGDIGGLYSAYDQQSKID